MSNNVSWTKAWTASYVSGFIPSEGGGPPTIINVVAPSDGDYTTGQALNFTVQWDQSVVVSGSPFIPLTLTTVGSGTPTLDYSSGTGSSSLVFSYTIVSGDQDSDGVGISSPIDLNSGTIKDTTGTQDATLTFTPPDTSGVTVNGVVDWSNYDGTGDKTPASFATSVNTSFGQTTDIIKLTDSTFLVLYLGASFYLRARIGSVASDGTITYGTESVIVSSLALQPSGALLDSSHVVICYELSSQVRGKVITFSGTEITAVGSQATIENFNSLSNSATAAFDGSSFITAYYSNANGVRLTYCTVSGTTITAQNTATTLTSQVANNVDLIKMTDSRMLLAIASDGTVDVEVSWINVVSDTPNVLDSVNPSISGDIGIARAVRLSDTKAAVAAYTETGGASTEMVIITESSDSLSAGTAVEISTLETDIITRSLGLAAPDADHVVHSICTEATNFKSGVAEVSGTSITSLSEYTNDTGDFTNLTNVAISQDWVVIMYVDDANSDTGYSQAITV